MQTFKLNLLLIAALLFPALCSAQGFRFDSTVTQAGQLVPGLGVPVIIPSGALIAFCNSPANAVPCTNKTTTYTSQTLATPCSTSTQIVLTGTTTCVANPDAQENWGVWVPAGNYAYTITIPGFGNFGPYNLTFGQTAVTATNLLGPGSISGTFGGNFTTTGIATIGTVAGTVNFTGSLVSSNGAPIGTVSQPFASICINTNGVGGGGTTCLSNSLVTITRAVGWPDAGGIVVLDTANQTMSGKTLTAPTINGTPTGTGIATLTLKKGTGAGNYTTASTTYVHVGAGELCNTVTILPGWKLAVHATGSLATATAAVTANVALSDNAACATDNAGILQDSGALGPATAAGAFESFNLTWEINGDGASHNIALQFKTSNGADSATMANSSATILPTMVFELMPSN